MSAGIRRLRNLAADHGAATALEYAICVAGLVLAFVLTISAWYVLAGRVSDLSNEIAQTGSGPKVLVSFDSQTK